MADCVYNSVADYLQSAEDMKDRIKKIDTVIAGMYLALEKAIASGHIQEYHIDDGQSRIRTIYRSVPDIEKGILGFEKLRVLYESKLGGRVINLRDHNAIC